ncbi:MAG: hypothetical protein ABDI07_07100 [Candidatus Kryptonium sp.]
MQEETKQELQTLDLEEEKRRGNIKEETEELIRELLDNDERSINNVQEKKRDLRKITLLGASFLLLSLLLVGVILLLKLLSQPTADGLKVSLIKEAANKTGVDENKNDKKSEMLSNTSDISTNDSRQLLAARSTEDKKPNYYLKLSDFLFPLDDRTFLKVDVFVYFDTPEDYRKAQGRELELRSFFYQELKKADKNFWRKEEQVRAYENRLRDTLNKGNFEFNSTKIILEGLMLKT